MAARSAEIGAGVRGTSDDFELLAASLIVMLHHSKVEAALTVLAERGVRTFERREEADFYLVGGVGRAGADNCGQCDRDC